MVVENIKNKIYYTCLAMLMVLLLQGCSSEKYAKEQAEVTVGKGRPIIEEYLNSLPEEAHITNISMLNGCKQGEPSFNARFPSHIVQAVFSAEDKYYIAVANIEDGKVYSNYEYIDPNELIQRQLMPYLDEYEFNGTYGVSGAFYSYVFVSHDVEVNKGDVRDVYVYLDNTPDLVPVENADEFMNASISGFDIEFESDNDEVFDPQILYKYLADTGNYRKENMRGDDREYHIVGGRKEQNRVSGEPSYYEMSIISEGTPDDMMCDVKHWDYKEENDFCYFYVGGEKNGNIKDLKEKEYVEYFCPFTYSGNELTYVRDEGRPYEGYLYLKNPGWNEIVMTRYALTNKSTADKTNDVVDRWELEALSQEELEAVKSESAELFELYSKDTKDKCKFTDDKVIINFK